MRETPDSAKNRLETKNLLNYHIEINAHL